jgi:hypothetical protein
LRILCYIVLGQESACCFCPDPYVWNVDRRVCEGNEKKKEKWKSWKTSGFVVFPIFKLRLFSSMAGFLGGVLGTRRDSARRLQKVSIFRISLVDLITLSFELCLHKHHVFLRFSSSENPKAAKFFKRQLSKKMDGPSSMKSAPFCWTWSFS